ncbi:rhombosortase [Alkalimonas sp.]|uniref:rhombosortase n=1 Tax=Alkalimonas sp. TaxID=1872453 RepID=UPI00263AE267|nr:rhombosortase [Alkalimonas sp.]MCC5824557.1 rhombosortase [Alkalimonas sp.]
MKRSLRYNQHPPWQAWLTAGTLLLGLTLLLWLPDSWVNRLNYQPTAVLSGEWWRLLTANLLHTNHWHLLLNLAGLSVLWLLHQRHFNTNRYLLWLLLAGSLTNLLLLLTMPQLDRMVGLSGALHAMVLLGALADIRHKDSTGWLLLALVLAKVAYEQIRGPDNGLAELIAAQVAVDAHLAGAIAGAMLFPLWWYLHKK